MAKKKVDPKAKAKRQKIFLAVGGVFLLGLLVVQVPRTMKMLKPQNESSSSSTTSSATSTTPASTPLAPPTLDGAAAATAAGAPSSAPSTATSVDGVSDPSTPLPPNAGQLVSFSKFKSKDPFHQQIADCATDSTGACASGSTPSAKPVSSTTPGSSTQRPSLVRSVSRPGPAKATRATISVNGTPSTVTVGRAFPAGAPVFTLVSLTTSGAKIGIAGGAYENGAATVALTKGKAVTLMNTADGSRYVLRLVSTA